MIGRVQSCCVCVLWSLGMMVFLVVGFSPSFAAITNPASMRDAVLAGKPVIGKNADGVLEVFEVDAKGEVRHRWQKRSNGDWSSWTRLGTGFLPGLAVANDAAGRMVVFAVDRTNNTLRCIWQSSTNSLNWSDWTDLGGAIRPPVATGRDADGRLEVFAVGATSNTVKHIWQTNSDGGWSKWSDLGGMVQPWLIVARNMDGRLELFGLNASGNTLMHIWQTKPNASGGWSEWHDLGGSILPGFSVGRNVLGILEVFGVNCTNGAVNRICQASPSDSREWTKWAGFGANVKPSLAVGKTQVGRLEIFALNARNSVLVHRWEMNTNGADIWSDWTNFGPACRSYPAVGQNEDGDLEVFAVDATNSSVIHHRRQISRSNGWLDWSTLDYRTLQYSSRMWQIDEGLPDDVVQAISQTSDGYLWVGTHDGLARFDGVQFTTFDARNTPVLKNSSVTALCAGRDEELWIGTDGGGLTRLKNGDFTHYGQSDGLAGNSVHAICEGKNGCLWIGTDSGMSRFENNQFTNYTTLDGLLSNHIRYIYEDRDGNLWIATSKGLNRLRTDGKVDSLPMPDGLPNDSVRGICQDKGGRIWVGSNNGLLWYNAYWGNSFYAYNTRYGLSDTFVSAICEGREDNLWVGTYSGLNRFWQGKFYNQLDNEGFPFDKVNVLFEDGQGDLWVGTQEGLVKLRPKRFVAYTRQNGLTHNNVTSILQDRNGNLWIGTWGGGLDELQGERIIAYASTNGLSQDLILSLCEGRDGSVWAGADYDGGLARLKNEKVTRYTWKDGLPRAGLKVLHEDRAGILWIGSSQGLFRMVNGKISQYMIRNQPFRNDVRSICEGRNGSLWVGTKQGLNCLRNGSCFTFTSTNELSDDSVLSLFEDADSNLWIGTETGGLDRFRNGKFTAYTTQQGLFSDEIFSVIEDNNGWLWMSCSKGVFRVRKRDFDAFDKGTMPVIRSIAYGKADGMETSQCNGTGKPASWKDRDGRIWFPTSKGLVEVDPAAMPLDRTPPQVEIEQVIADRKPLVSSARRLKMDAGNPMRVPPGRGEIQFQYSALSLSAPGKCRFKYRLDTIDSDWVDAGTRRTAYYNNILPGRYRFHVIACNQDGVWNERGAALTIIMLPHYWQTLWFRLLAALLVIGSISGVLTYLTRRRMKHKLELLKQRHAIEQERGRIAKDIHDDLGSSLTRITMLGERAEEGLARREDVATHVQKIVSSARQTVQSLDEIVWAVNPENDTLDGLVGYISHYANEFFENTDVRCRLEIPDELPAIAIAAETRHSLFLIVKEAFNNVLKHSRASEVRVCVIPTALSVRLLIEDNGAGFDSKTEYTASGRKGNGLGNMRKRMEDLNGRFHVSSIPGKGTSLELAINVDSNRRSF